MFQFHMVRLKDATGRTCCKTPYCVSIPYGTIKRYSSVLSDMPKPVSIPYGTIKRISGSAENTPSTLFQFHMVRLKDDVFVDEPSIIMFQFHMVRLKGFSASASIPRVEFQFHMVRLKARTILTKGKLSWVSIPYGTIKSLEFEVPMPVLCGFNSIWYD